MERDVASDGAKVVVTRQQRCSGVACRESDQDIILQAGEPNRLVVGEQTREQSASVEPALPPRRRFDRNELTDKLGHGSKAPPAGAAEQFARHDGRQPDRSRVYGAECSPKIKLTAQHRNVDTRVKEGDHRNRGPVQRQPPRAVRDAIAAARPPP